MRLKLTRGHALKLRASTRIPAQIVGGTATTVTRANGVYTIDVDTTEVADLLSPTVLNRANHTGQQLASTISDLATEILARSKHTGTQTASTISDFSEATDDRVAALLVAGTNISLSYNDGSGSLTINNTQAPVTSIAGNTGAFTLANGIDNSTNQIQLTAARRTLPTTQVFTSGSGTYTTPANCLWIEVELVGGGGGGAGSGTTPGNGGSGGATTWGTGPLLSSGTASGATGSTGGAGGTPSGGFVNKTGGTGSNGSGANTTIGGFGANSPYGGAGAGGAPGGGAGVAAAANSGSGGGGAGVNATVNGGGGGGAGGFVRAIINSPSATYAYAVGAAGAAGTTGTGGAAGGAGGSGFIQVTEHYGS